ncbi:ribonuclease H-like domain-containing protein [Tanacetum coccineum]|uniref:Ribonuclease H-like domain-containing protein n=1 Tax=Tanacetum coccineum TaxID=301880 RepID=A0ABQ5HTM1_9ASTR
MLYPTMLLTQMKSYVPSFLNKHPCLQLMMMKTCYKLMKIAIGSIDTLGAVAYDNCKDMEVYEDEGRPIDLCQRMGSLLTNPRLNVLIVKSWVILLESVGLLKYQGKIKEAIWSSGKEDYWVDSDDEETDVSESQKETVFNSENSETSFENRSPNSQNSVGQESRTKGTWEQRGVQGKQDSLEHIQRVNHSNFSRNSSGHTHTVKKYALNVTDQGTAGSRGNPEEDFKAYAIIDSGMLWKVYDMRQGPSLSDLKVQGWYWLLEEMTLKKHNVLFTDKECLILSPKFKFVDEDLVILRAPRKNDVYSLDLKNIIPSGGITCLVAKATEDEAVLWHRRLGHVNFKNINKLVKGNLVRGLSFKDIQADLLHVWHVEKGVNSTGHLARD